MPGTMTVELTRLRFHAYHGLYAEEKLTGNGFEVNLFVHFSCPDQVITGISETVDYTRLYALVKTEMEKPRDLLETLAMEIVQQIRHEFPSLSSADISIQKLTAPIPQFDGNTGIRYRKDFK